MTTDRIKLLIEVGKKAAATPIVDKPINSKPISEPVSY